MAEWTEIVVMMGFKKLLNDSHTREMIMFLCDVMKSRILFSDLFAATSYH